jgi:hypothetical protein
MRLFNSNPGSLMTVLKKDTGRTARSPEAVNPAMRNIARPTVPRSLVERISSGNANTGKPLKKGDRWLPDSNLDAPELPTR